MSRYKKIYVFVLIIFTLFPIRLFANDSFLLITEDEYLEQLKHKGKTSSKGMFFSASKNAPKIVIDFPPLSTGVISPTNIQVKFKAAGDASIVADLLKVLYGFFSLDITDRIKKHATISSSGLIANNVELPKGEHTITIRIKDTKDREAEKDVTFSIIVPSN